MEPYEKEEMLFNDTLANIEHFLLENHMTYFQILGTLDAVKAVFTEEFFEQAEEQQEEN